jgi:hypothetical protein
VANLFPGQRPTVQFTVSDRDGGRQVVAQDNRDACAAGSRRGSPGTGRRRRTQQMTPIEGREQCGNCHGLSDPIIGVKAAHGLQ